IVAKLKLISSEEDGARSDRAIDQTSDGVAAKEDALAISPETVTKTPKKRRSARGNDVRQRVLKAALECFGLYGFEGTSTRTVAKRADVTHTLLLYHFQSKEQLWIATMDAA